MASFTICPRCTSHLEWPPTAGVAAQVQCPVCEVEFSLATVSRRELPRARLMPADESPVEAEGADDSPQARLARLLQSAAVSEAAAPPAAPRGDVEPEAPADELPPVGGDGLLAGSSDDDSQTPAASRLDRWLDDFAAQPAGQSSATAPAGATDDWLAASAAAADDAAFEYEDAGEYDEAEEGQVIPSLVVDAGGVELGESLRATGQRRGPSGLRMLVGVVGGGGLGLLLGAYVLLWLRGPAGDVAGLSRWLPARMLPASMRSQEDRRDEDGAATSSTDAARLAADGSADPVEPTEPAEPLAEDAPLRRDEAVTPAAAVEPVIASAPPVESTPSPVDALQGMPRYTAEELRASLSAAEAGLREFLAGDLARRESWSSMGPAYVTLAALAERYTLSDAASPADEFAADRRAAAAIFHGAASDPARRRDLATIASRWLQHERRQNSGVLLVGTVRESRQVDRWTELTIEVPLGDESVIAHVLTFRTGETPVAPGETPVAPGETPVAPGDEIAAVGVILSRPEEQLPAYAGASAPSVVAALLFEPAAPLQPDRSSAPEPGLVPPAAASE